jgi:hypothetical protein
MMSQSGTLVQSSMALFVFGAKITADFIYTCVALPLEKVDQARAVHNFSDLSTARSLAVCL